MEAIWGGGDDGVVGIEVRVTGSIKLIFSGSNIFYGF